MRKPDGDAQKQPGPRRPANCDHNCPVTIGTLALPRLQTLRSQMRALAVAAIIASLTVPAYAQDSSKEQSNREAEQRKKEEEEAIEKA